MERCKICTRRIQESSVMKDGLCGACRSEDANMKMVLRISKEGLASGQTHVVQGIYAKRYKYTLSIQDLLKEDNTNG